MAERDAGIVAAAFQARFGTAPRVFRAPGRINIIGEHTDYCDGLAMPAAIDRVCLIAAAPNGTNSLRIVSRETGEGSEVDLADLAPRHAWTDYVAGVAAILGQDGVPVAGADLMIASDVPMGAGVSSSAALEVATAHALLALSGRSATPLQIALWAQAAENRFVGMPCGLMDQFASAHGVDGAALLLDCRARTGRPLPLPADAAFLVINSMVRHAHVGGAYAERRQDCEEAAALMGVAALRDVTPEKLEVLQGTLPPRVARRARHVVSEIARVEAAAVAIAAGDLARLGALMNASHHSLQHDMEVSIEALDRLAGIARAAPGIHGARMMGGGFGGCVIALAARHQAAEALETISSAYGAWHGEPPSGFLCTAVAGAGEIAHV
jgi:galactokinase